MRIMMVVMMMTMMSSCMTKREGDVSERSGSSSNWQICTNHFFLQSAARGRKGQGCSAFSIFSHPTSVQFRWTVFAIQSWSRRSSVCFLERQCFQLISNLGRSKFLPSLSSGLVDGIGWMVVLWWECVCWRVGWLLLWEEVAVPPSPPLTHELCFVMEGAVSCLWQLPKWTQRCWGWDT